VVCYRLTFASAATVATLSWQRQLARQFPNPPINTGITVICDLGIYIDADVLMRSHVTKTVSGCFAILRQLRSVRRSVSRSVFQSLAVSLVLSQLDHGNATLSGIPQYLLRRLQSVMNSDARLVFFVVVRPHHSGPPSGALAQGCGAN